MSLIPSKKLTDFEKNLFLKKEVKELKQKIKDLTNGEEIKKLNLEIGFLKSELSEVKDKLVRFRNWNQKNGKQKLKLKVKNQAEEINRLKQVINNQKLEKDCFI
ncbi:hypothetical protein [Seonamhaeicola sp.]|uniref:hypothetical protein n=1 Tax=Seonamhaeicola sp. TaxID=1912245 RepID=UPI00356B3ADD